jgi:hypothetical protein
MKQNDIKIQPVRNRVAEIYTKVTGRNIIGELMMAAGADNQNILAAYSLFDCEMNSIVFFYVLSTMPTTEPSVTITHNGETYNAIVRGVGEIDSEIISTVQTAFDIDLSPFIGKLLLSYGADAEIVEGDTYTFYIDGKQILTSEAVCFIVPETEEPQTPQS